MQTTTLHLIVFALALAVLATIAIAWIGANKAHLNGYQAGYEDAERGQQPHIQALHQDISRLTLQHQADREALLLDCDSRIAHYARRSNPFTASDAVDLMKISGQLQVLATAAENVGDTNRKAWATIATDNAKGMAQRIREALEAAEHPPEALPDSARLDWLEDVASAAADFGTFSLYFPVSDDFPGTQTIRAAIDFGMQHAATEAAA